MKKFFFTRALIAGLITGSLDITAAFIQYFVRTGKNPLAVLPFIASGVFGKKAFAARPVMMLWGLVFHFIIAILFAFLYFWLAWKFPSLVKNKWRSGALYGVFIWGVMQFIVVPLSATPKFPFNFSSAGVAMLLLIACIGLPLAWLAGQKTKDLKKKNPTLCNGRV